MQLYLSKVGDDIQLDSQRKNTFRKTEFQFEKFEDGLFDWVYLDSDHGYENVARELEICRKKVKIGGIIAGHDYVTGQWLKRERYGVVEAVNEFCHKYNWEMIYLTNEQHRNLSYALRQIAS